MNVQTFQSNIVTSLYLTNYFKNILFTSLGLLNKHLFFFFIFLHNKNSFAITFQLIIIKRKKKIPIYMHITVYSSEAKILVFITRACASMYLYKFSIKNLLNSFELCAVEYLNPWMNDANLFLHFVRNIQSSDSRAWNTYLNFNAIFRVNVRMSVPSVVYY